MPGRVLAITTGEPAGVGPELCAQIAQRAWPVPLVAIGDPALLYERAAQLGIALKIRELDDRTPEDPAPPGHLWVAPVPLRRPSRCGLVDTGNAPYVLDLLNLAIDGCRNGRFAAMVTAPAHKGVINDAGIPFTGHTEYIAGRAGGRPVMMLSCPGLRVALVTTHLALRAVADAISAERIERVLRILDNDLRHRFGIDRPRILVCGLNPHAGEGGHLGREEIEVIEPVLRRLTAEGLSLQGPLPADTAFTPPRLRDADVVLAMYHDQGLPVLKHMGFGSAVNITLGLPLIRTSVDHGTALDLAGTGNANPDSLAAAISVAIEMLENSAQETTG